MAKRIKTPRPVTENMLERADNFARREPLKAIVSGFGAGFLINLLPLRALASAVVGIALSSVRPVLFFLGLMKAREFCLTQKTTNDRHE